jgi:hypothetical protein
MRNKYASTTRPVSPLREFINTPARTSTDRLVLLDDRQRSLIAMFDEGRDAWRGAANDTRDCIRTEHVARHKHRRDISGEDHLGSAATLQVDNAGLHVGKK